MAEMMRRATDQAQLLSLDIPRPVMAKAHVQIQDIDWQKEIAQAVKRAVSMLGWSDKEAADRIGVDAAEYARWMTDDEHRRRRPHLDRIFAVPELRKPAAMCLAGLVPGVEVVIQIRSRQEERVG